MGDSRSPAGRERLRAEGSRRGGKAGRFTPKSGARGDPGRVWGRRAPHLPGRRPAGPPGRAAVGVGPRSGSRAGPPSSAASAGRPPPPAASGYVALRRASREAGGGTSASFASPETRCRGGRGGDLPSDRACVDGEVTGRARGAARCGRHPEDVAGNPLWTGGLAASSLGRGTGLRGQ